MAQTSRLATRRTQEDRRAESDRRILGAAMRLIARNGAAGTTLAEIGIAAGYSRGLPAERFGTKHALLACLIDRTEEAFQAQLALDVGGRTGWAAVAARVEAHLNGAARSPDALRALYLLYMESLTVVPELHARIAALGRTYREGFARDLRAAQRTGEIRSDVDLREQAVIIVGALRGTLVQWAIEPAAIDLMAAKRALVSMISDSLLLQAPAAARTASAVRRGRRGT